MEACTNPPFFTVHGKGTCFHDGNLDSIQKEGEPDGEDTPVETVCEMWPASVGKISRNDAKLFALGRTYLVSNLLIMKYALADLEGVMPEFEPDGARKHSGWKTIEQLKQQVKKLENVVI